MSRAGGFRAGLGRLLRLLVALLVLVLPGKAGAEPVPLDIGSAGFVDLRPTARLLVDATRTKKLADLQHPELLEKLPLATTESVHRGFSDSAYWLAVSLVQHGSGKVQRFLRVYPTVDRADIYVETARGVSHRFAGRREPFALRAVRDTDLLFPIELSPDEPARLYVRLAGSDVIRLDLELLDAETLASQLANRRLIWGLCYGTIGALCLYNLVLMFWLRDRAYLYYVLFQGALTSLVAALDHLTLQYLWPNSPVWSANFETIAVMLSVYGACGFVSSFLAAPNQKQIGERWLRSCQVVALVLLAGFPLTAWLPFAIAGVVFVLFATATIMVITTVSVLQGNTTARFLLGSWIVLAAGALAVVSSTLTTWDLRWPLEHLVRLGSVVEAVLLSFGLAYRINLLRRENERMTRDMLHQRVAALNNLVNGITHEIANPLHFVQSGAELLEAHAGKNPDPRSADALEIIKTGSKRIDLVVSNLRQQLSGAPPAFEATNVTQVLRETIDLMKGSFEEQGIVVRAALGELPTIRSRPGELGQVFTNLLLNACQAMKAGGELVVEAAADPSAVRVTIADNGPGVPLEHQTAIFDPFFTTRGPKEGAGLGLYVALQIMWNHAGNLELMPSERGAKFRVTIARQVAH